MRKKKNKNKGEEEESHIRTRIREFVEGKVVTVVMSVSTVYALFGVCF